jgi:hypothetical protein
VLRKVILLAARRSFAALLRLSAALLSLFTL